ncbi:MAG: 16S rRNA (guanine(527)-N(7))-methyltransferase RsmG [Pseudomonadota bacterium]
MKEKFACLLKKLLPDAWINDQQCHQLADYLVMLTKWNRHYNLTAIREPDRMVTHHILDSLAIAEELSGHAVLDLGTGAGLPGIPLAIVKPQMTFTLLDSQRKKLFFCQHVVARLALDNVKIIHKRVQDWQPVSGFDMIITRAFATIDKTIAVAEHLLNEQGVFLLMKGKAPTAELKQLPSGYAYTMKSLCLPGLDEQRHILRIYRQVLSNEEK